MGILTSILGWLTGGGIKMLVSRWTALERERLRAKNNDTRLQLEWQQSRIEAQIKAAELANDDRWSATSLGRYFIVIPFGVWWTAIFIDSTFDMPWDVLALPPTIMSMASWLVPAIIIGDVGRFAIRRLK